MVAARIATLPHGVRSDRQESPIGESKTQADAADLLNVGKRSVERARVILEDGTPELIGAVERDEIAVSTAAEQAKVNRFSVVGGPSSRRSGRHACVAVIYIPRTIYGKEPPGTALVCGLVYFFCP